MYTYPVKLEPDDGTILVTFPDVPGAITFGEDEADALARATDALLTMFTALMSDRKDIPLPSKLRKRQASVTVPPLAAAKIALYRAMRDSGVGKAELGRRLGWHLPQVDRLLDLRHASRIEQLDQALHAVGKKLVIEVQDAA